MKKENDLVFQYPAYFGFDNPPPAGSGTQLLIGSSDSTSIDSLNAAGGWSATGAKATLDAWREIGVGIKSYKVGTTPGKMNLWYNGAKVATDLPVYATSASSWTFQCASVGNVYYVDNFELGHGPMPQR